MTRPGIEPQPPGSLVNTLPIKLMDKSHIKIVNQLKGSPVHRITLFIGMSYQFINLLFELELHRTLSRLSNDAIFLSYNSN